MTKLTILKIGGNIFSLKTLVVLTCICLIYKIETLNNEIITVQEQLIDINVRMK